MNKAEIIRKLKALHGDWEKLDPSDPDELTDFAYHAEEKISNILEQFTDEEIQAAIMKE